MPSREDIDRFMKVLDTVGAPAEIPPDEARPGGEGTAEEAALPEEGPPPDIGELLGSFEGLESPLAPEETQPAAEAPQESGEEFAGLDFGSLFGEESAAGPLEVIGEPETPAAEGIETPPPDFEEPPSAGLEAQPVIESQLEPQAEPFFFFFLQPQPVWKRKAWKCFRKTWAPSMS